MSLPPADPPLDRPAASAGGGAVQAQPPLVLVVEDSEVQSMVLRRLLEKEGFRVVSAANGCEGLERLREHPVELAISDITMPEMDGYQLCAAMKASSLWQGIPVILLTSLSDPSDIVRGLESRADYYLTKPYNRRFLLDHVRALLRRSSQRAPPEAADPGLEIELDGGRHVVTASRRQMLALLLSTYEGAIQQNRELLRTQQELGQRNQELRAQSQRLEVSERNFRTLLETNIDGMMVVDDQGTVRFCNAAACRLLDRAEAQVVGRPFEFALGAGTAIEVVIPHQGQEPVVAELRGVETAWKGEPALLAALRDITQRKQDERQIREQQARLEEANRQLQALAITDGLTGLRNHRAFKERLAEEFGRARRFRHPLALLMLDVDHFKPFNDTFGHPAGDEVLRQLARVLRLHTRQTDLAARYGGEEFAILLPNTGATEAIFLGERLRQLIEAGPWDKRPVTVSMGLSCLLPAMEQPEALLSAADQALYRSKANGRNRLTPAEPPPSPG